MVTTSSLMRSDPLARVRVIFRQQLQAFLNNTEPVEADEIYQGRIHELELLYTACPHYLQSDYRENYARKHTAELISRRIEILAQFRAFHQDTAFIAYLKQSYPHLYLLGKHETILLALAEKFDAATRHDGTTVTSSARRKPTPEEVRGFKVRRQQVQTDDKIALARGRLEATLKARAFLGDYDLDPDERAQLEQELVTDILSGEDEQTTNHKQPTTGYKQL